MSSDRTLYLVDGTYLLFRAYHSLPVSMAVTGAAYEKNRIAIADLLREGAGTAVEPPGVADPTLAWLADPARDRIPTNAVRGLVSVLLKLIREERPTHMGVAFDLPGKVHRDDHYESFALKHPDYAAGLEGYKATRPETPVEIHVQFPLARIACARALGIPVLEAVGFEADDLIGTLARRARDRGFTVRLVTADKDLFQLVDEGIFVLNPHKSPPSKPSSYLLMDAAVVEKEFGVPPSQVVDVLALMGDASDNIPGVPGIGEKGARELVRRYGSVEGCLEAAKDESQVLRPAYRRGLLEHAALALFSKELATIREDAPIEVNLDDVWAHAPDKDRLRQVFGLLAFGGLLREVENLPSGSPSAGAGGQRSAAVSAGSEVLDGEGASRRLPPAEGPRGVVAGPGSGSGEPPTESREQSGRKPGGAGVGEPTRPGSPAAPSHDAPAVARPEAPQWGLPHSQARTDSGEAPGPEAHEGAGPEAAEGTRDSLRRPVTATRSRPKKTDGGAVLPWDEEAGRGTSLAGSQQSGATASRSSVAAGSENQEQDRHDGARGTGGGAVVASRGGEPAGAVGGESEARGSGGARRDGPTDERDSAGEPVERVGLVSAEEASCYRAVLNLGELESLLPAMLGAPRVAVNTETTSEDPMRAELVGISLAWEPHRAIYVPIAHRYLGAPEQPCREEVLRVLAPLLESASRVKTGQNVKYDIEVLVRAGARPAAFGFDTMIAAFLIEPDRQSFALGALAKEYIGDYKIPFSQVTQKGAKQVPFDQVEIEQAAIYSGRDADVTLRLAGDLDGRLAAENLHEVFDGIDMPLIEVLVAMEMRGVRIDIPLLSRLSKEMGEQIATLRTEIHRLAGREFNVDSPRQLGAILFDEIGLKPLSRTAKSGVSSTRDEDLEALAARHPLPARVRDYRVLAKLRSTYVDALPVMVNPETGRVHTSFHPTGAATGRLSSSDPNLQNIPVRTEAGRKIRAAFVPEPGWTLVSADYSQVELRVMAQISGDPDLRATFARGEDIHKLTAARIYGVSYESVTYDQRRAAKTINFGILYGMGPQRLARELSIAQGAAKDLIDSYFGRFPRIRAYIDETISRAEKAGYVTTLFGRIRRFPGLTSTSRFQRQLAIRAAVNSTIQGTAADLMKIAMVRLHHELRRRRLEARLLIQVHDELVLEAPPGEIGELEKVIRDAMEGIPLFEVPLVVDISSGPNWLEAKP